MTGRDGITAHGLTARMLGSADKAAADELTRTAARVSSVAVSGPARWYRAAWRNLARGLLTGARPRPARPLNPHGPRTCAACSPATATGVDW